ncbi:MAG: FtsQ-type POTRA domain-containing protein [Actinomycetales bacterium]|nr:FtsQ-type POTRA domain-containing protein [Actinomycetales bacterium]
MTVVESAQRFGAAERTRRTRRWAVLAALVVLLGVGAWVVWFSPLLTVREVRVLGAVEVSADSVRSAAAVPVGIPLARVDSAGIVERVGALPRVASVEVRRGWPDVLVVVVTERVPLAVTREGTAYTYLDATGARFGTLNAVPRGLPLVTAASDPALTAALGVCAALPGTLVPRVSTVTARTRDDVVLTLSDGTAVQWGGPDDSAHKAAVLLALLKVGARSYDVSAPDLPTTRGTGAARP